MTFAMVTGSCSGIGLATAGRARASGHTVAATMRNLDNGAEVHKISAK
jgi:NAD(P)-dependent dehydrogenase (short-subunit alcohol dehydrogenase family)